VKTRLDTGVLLQHLNRGQCRCREPGLLYHRARNRVRRLSAGPSSLPGLGTECVALCQPGLTDTSGTECGRPQCRSSSFVAWCRAQCRLAVPQAAVPARRLVVLRARYQRTARTELAGWSPGAQLFYRRPRNLSKVAYCSPATRNECKSPQVQPWLLSLVRSSAGRSGSPTTN
jgi:hypothetical protein